MARMTARAWTYFNPVRIVFDPGAVTRGVTGYVDSERIALITSPSFRARGLVAGMEEAFGKRLVSIVDDVKPNPGLLDVEAQGKRLRASSPDTLIALGGGSTIDTAKALARLLAGTEDTAALLGEQTSRSSALALPVIAIPTTSGTGAEVTPFATVWDYERRKKGSVAGDDLYPRLAILDPELTLELPEHVTVSSGLDAISHALESVWNRNASPATLAFSTRSLQLSLTALPRAKAAPRDKQARGEMMQASVLAGLAISQSRTALAHAISYPLTVRYDLPHGLACSFTLPALLRFNAASDDGRLSQLSRDLGYSGTSELARALARLLDQLEVGEQLRRYLPDRQSVLALADQMFAPGRAENNLREASTQEVRAIVGDSLDTLRA